MKYTTTYVRELSPKFIDQKLLKNKNYKDSARNIKKKVPPDGRIFGRKKNSHQTQ